MDFSCPPQLLVVAFEEALLGSELGARDPIIVVVAVMLHDLADREVSIGVLLRHGNGVVNILLPGAFS